MAPFGGAPGVTLSVPTLPAGAYLALATFSWEVHSQTASGFCKLEVGDGSKMFFVRATGLATITVAGSVPSGPSIIFGGARLDCGGNGVDISDIRLTVIRAGSLTHH